MHPVFTRILMWILIVSAVWVAARFYTPPAEQDRDTQAMLDAARHYQRYKAELGKDDEVPAVADSGPGAVATDD